MGIRYYHDDKPMPDSQNKMSSVAYYFTKGLEDGKARLGTKDFVTLLNTVGVQDVSAVPWTVTLANGVVVSAREDPGVPSGATINRLAAQSIGDREAKVDRLTALKAENAAVKAWEAAGSTGERPPTPLHDAAAEKAPRPNPARTTAAKKATTGRARQIRKAVKA